MDSSRGRFVETLYFYSLVRAGACVAVRADPPPDVGMSPDSVTRRDAVFFEGGAVDTVRVRLVLRPR